MELNVRSNQEKEMNAVVFGTLDFLLLYCK